METLSLIACIFFICISLYFWFQNRSLREEVTDANINMRHAITDKVQTEATLLSERKVSAELRRKLSETEKLLKTTYDKLTDSESALSDLKSEIDKTGVRRASDGTFRSTDDPAPAPRKRIVVKKKLAPAPEV